MILELIKEKKIKEVVELLETTAKKNVDKHTLEYNNDRKIRTSQVGKRLDKPTSNGDVVVAKIPIPFQRKIVKTAASFLFASPVKLIKKGENEEFVEEFQKLLNLWDDVRMDTLLLKFAKTVKSETEASIIFYPVKSETDNTYKVKARLLDSSNGKVFPYFDEFGDMIAFGWQFEKIENSKPITYLYLYTAETNYIFRKEKDWEIAAENGQTPNLFKKIPIVYLSQTNPEWWEVQEMIDRYEMSFSKFCDTNDYFASPKYKATGKLKKSIADSQVVELDVIETDKGTILKSDLEVISWDRAPESLKLEFETNKGLIYDLTDTPDLSFDNVKGIGNVSGIALKLMFLGPILKAKFSEGDYQVVVSRVINILKAGIGNVIENGGSEKLDEMKVVVNFTSILPENLKEIIEILSEATGGKASISQKTAIANNPMVEDNDAELEMILQEEKEAKTAGLGETVTI